jgi:phospholipid/cholesterol/gamma-HCH transport system substrate-binding protein
MAKHRVRDLSVGAMFALALLIIALTVMAVGGESRLFVQKSHYSVIFPNAEGLRVGSPVKIAGVVVGTVTEISLSTDPEKSGIEVEVGVDRSFTNRVREDSLASLRIHQLLSGEKFVEIIPGSPESPRKPQGSVIEPEEAQEILEQAAVTAENLNDITISLKNILGALERGDGLMGQMISDPEFGQQGLAALRGALENLEVLTSDILEGQGFAGRLLYDESFTSRVDTLSETLDGLADMIARASAGEGGVGAMFATDGAGQQAIEDFREAASRIRIMSERLNSKEGLLGRLINDPEYSEAVARDVRATFSNLAEITDKINSGQGTLGRLINERELHDSAEEIIVGVDDSKFARWVLRHYRKKGIKAEEEQAEAGQ